MLITKAKEIGKIPPEFHDSFPDYCSEPGCRTPLEISENRKRVWCPNIRCMTKVAHRMTDMLVNFGIKDMGFAYCHDMVRQNKYKSHVSILVADLAQHPTNVSAHIATRNIENIRKVFEKVYMYKNLISMIALPGLGVTAQNIFQGISSYEQYVSVLQNYRNNVFEFVSARTNGHIKSSEYARTLLEFDAELRVLSNIFKIRPDAKQTVNIAVTGGISKIGRMSRDEFGELINGLAQGVYEFRIGKALASAKWVVADSPSNSTTYEAGLERGILITSEELVNKIKEEVGL